MIYVHRVACKCDACILPAPPPLPPPSYPFPYRPDLHAVALAQRDAQKNRKSFLTLKTLFSYNKACHAVDLPRSSSDRHAPILHNCCCSAQLDTCSASDRHFTSFFWCYTVRSSFPIYLLYFYIVSMDQQTQQYLRGYHLTKASQPDTLCQLLQSEETRGTRQLW